MSILKMKEIKNISEKEREEKVKELRIELIKKKSGKDIKLKAKEIKKAIARLLTLKQNK